MFALVYRLAGASFVEVKDMETMMDKVQIEFKIGWWIAREKVN